MKFYRLNIGASKVFALTIPLFFLAGCQSSITNMDKKAKQIDSLKYSAQIQRTSYNIPHITAKDMPSAWFGQGYAMAEDRICVLLDQVTKVRSHRSRFFGAGDFEENLSSDFGYKHLGLLSNAENSWDWLPINIQDMLTAHAAGINQFIKDKGASKLPKDCRNAAWITHVKPTDLMAIVSDFNILLSGRFLVTALSNAAPPNDKEKPSMMMHHDHHVSAEESESPGSNGWGLGGDLTKSGNGILLAQPHFPWEGELQAWESHITVPGEIDIYGITVPGIPNNLVGFNESVAWTLTVTTSPKATLYQLKLDDNDPTKYSYDGKVREMESTDYSIDVKTKSGKIEQQTRTLWRSHYGPILSVPAMLTGGIVDYSWSKNLAMTYRDINLDNQTLLSQFLAMSQADGMDSFIEAHKKWAGSIPFSNTVATSVGGDAWYADSSPVPNISAETYQAWQKIREKDAGIAALSEYHGIYVFDGSTSRDEWVIDSQTARAGLAPFADAPQLRRRDFVFNSNGTHWLTNPDSLLEGYAPIYGKEGDNPSLRTRMNAIELAKGSLTNKFSIDDVKEMSLANRSITATLVTDELVMRCKKTAVVTVDSKKINLKQACKVLANWDQKFDLDSKGAVLFREFLGFVSSLRHGHALFTGEGTLFAKPFDRKKPISTPNGLAQEETILVALGQAVKEMTEAKIPLDARLYNFQFTVKNGKKIPIHGGNSREGILSIAAYGANATMLPSIQKGEEINSVTGLTKEGYVVNYGTSFLMAVELTPKGPKCQAIMSFSQSIDPESPCFSDQTKLYSNKEWRACHYSQAAILADPAVRTYSVGN